MICKVCAALLLTTALSSAALCAEPKDVERVAAFVLNTTIPVTKRTTGASEDESTVMVVFEYQGQRYAIEVFSPQDDGVSGVGFHLQSQMSDDPAHTDSFSDWRGDGIVDYGVMYDGSKYYEYVPSDDPEDVTLGEEYREYWQAEYDKAVDATLAYIESVKKE